MAIAFLLVVVKAILNTVSIFSLQQIADSDRGRDRAQHLGGGHEAGELALEGVVHLAEEGLGRRQQLERGEALLLTAKISAISCSV